MRLGLRMLFVVMLFQGITAFFVLRIFGQEIKPSVREAMEEQLVDAANILAEFAAAELVNGQISNGNFAQAVAAYQAREIKANIWGLSKERMDFRVYVTDAKGIVVYDSQGQAVGRDFSQWRDVNLTLQGRYGARTSHIVSEYYNAGPTMHVGAAVRANGHIVGALTVVKPQLAVQAFVDRAQRRVLINGIWMLALSTLVGVAVTLWVVWQVRRIRAYAQTVQLSKTPPPLPQAPGELGDLAKALDGMRQRLDGTQYVQDYVRALTHELKSPIAAVAANAELLQDDMPAAQRRQFAQDIAEQSQRMQRMVQRMLELAKLEQLPSDEVQKAPVVLSGLVHDWQHRNSARLEQLDVKVVVAVSEQVAWHTDAALLAMALGNVLDNALEFSTAGCAIDVTVRESLIEVRDHGPGVPEYALQRLGERFFTTARPNGERSGSGLGLAISQRIGERLGFSLHFEAANPGLRVTLSRT